MHQCCITLHNMHYHATLCTFMHQTKNIRKASLENMLLALGAAFLLNALFEPSIIFTSKRRGGNSTVLNFILNKPVSWMGYSLDGKETVTFNVTSPFPTVPIAVASGALAAVIGVSIIVHYNRRKSRLASP
jgi:hypothetical protein